MSEQQAQANEGQQRAAEVFHSTADTWALRCWNDWALRYWNEINECLDVEAALGAVAASPDEDGGCVVCGGKHYLRGPAPKGGSAYEVTPCPACNAEGEKPRYTFADELREKPVAGPADEEHWPT